MNKNLKYYAACWGVLVVVFNVICFVTAGNTVGVENLSGTFWISYVFIMISLIGQLFCAFLALKEDNLQKVFYKLPLVTISYGATVLSALVGIICMVIPGLPSWVGIILCVLLLGGHIVAIVTASAASDIVAGVDAKIKRDTFFIKSLTVDAESLMLRATNEEIKSELKKVYETVRYADPMSSEMLASVEGQITIAFEALRDAVVNGDHEMVKGKANEVIILVGDRNRKCKMLK